MHDIDSLINRLPVPVKRHFQAEVVGGKMSGTSGSIASIARENFAGPDSMICSIADGEGLCNSLGQFGLQRDSRRLFGKASARHHEDVFCPGTQRIDTRRLNGYSSL